MSNPALELAEILEGWQTSAGDAYSPRGGTNPGSNDYWREHGRAVDLLRQVDAALASLRALGKRTDPYDKYVTAWYRGIFHPDAQWNTTYRGSIDAAALAALHSFALLIDMTAGSSLVTERQRATVVDCLNDAVELLAENQEGLSEAERLYVLRLVETARSIFEDSAVLGGVDLQATLDRLNGALLGAATHLNAVGNTDGATKLSSVAVRLVSAIRGFVYDTAAVATIVGTPFTVAAALTQGS